MPADVRPYFSLLRALLGRRRGDVPASPEPPPGHPSASKPRASTIPRSVPTDPARLALAKGKIGKRDLIDRADDPSKILDQLIQDMNEQFINATRQLAQAIADERSLQEQAEQEAASAVEWERKAMLAVRHGDDKLAMEAQQHKQQHDLLAEQHKARWQRHCASVSQRKDALRILSDKIENATLEKRLIEAPLKRTEAGHHIRKNSVLAEFDRKKKVDQMEAENEANRLLSEEDAGDHTDR